MDNAILIQTVSDTYVRDVQWVLTHIESVFLLGVEYEYEYK